MTLAVVLAALRMVVWTAALLALAPRLVAGRSRGRLASVATLVLVASAAATLLWLSGRMERGLFLLTLALFVGLAGARPWDGRAALRAREAWARFADAFYDPGAHEGARYARPFGREGAAIPGGARARDDFAGVVQRARHATLAALGVNGGAGPFAAFRAWARGPRAEPQAALVVAALAGVFVAAVRSLRDHPLGQAEVETLLRSEHVLGWRGAWLPDLAVEKLFTSLAAALPAEGAVALAAPVILVSAWSGVSLVRRLAPGTAPWVGAFVGAVLAARGLAGGLTIGPAMAFPLLLPWAALAATFGRRRGGAAILVGLAIAHPAGAALGGASAIAALGAGGKVSPRATWKVILGTAAALGLGALLLRAGGAGFALLVPAKETAPLERWVAVVGLAVSMWLLFAPREDRSRSVVAAGRGLAVATLLACGAAGGFDGAPHLALPHLTASALVALAATVTAVELGGAVLVRAELLAAASVVLAGVLAFRVTPPAPRHDGLPRGAMEAADALRAENLPWEFTVVGSPQVLGAFVGVTWFVDPTRAETLRDRARTTAGGRASPFTTPKTYAVMSRETEGDDTRAWLDAVARAPQPLCAREASARSDVAVYTVASCAP